jgi:hypothetical protein
MQMEFFSFTDPYTDTSVKLKKCSKCALSLPLSAFRKRGGENYLRTECKKCSNKLVKQRMFLRRKYGTPPVDYVCPICSRQKEECMGEGSNSASPWALDHSHDTGEFRSWLCHKCNRGLGAFNDNVFFLKKAINYIKNADVAELADATDLKSVSC